MSSLPEPVPFSFFDQPPVALAVQLLGKVIFRKVEGLWLACQVIETEAYYLDEKGSHSSLGRTPSREAMFMSPGTIYMYYSRGKPSLNISARGEGNAVLVKAGVPWRINPEQLGMMIRGLGRNKPADKVCSGQTLLCEALHLQVEHWREKQFDARCFYVADMGEHPAEVIQARRLGIAAHRDAHLPYRFVDAAHVRQATQNPLKRTAVAGRDYWRLSWDQALQLTEVHR